MPSLGSDVSWGSDPPQHILSHALTQVSPLHAANRWPGSESGPLPLGDLISGRGLRRCPKGDRGRFAISQFLSAPPDRHARATKFAFCSRMGPCAERSRWLTADEDRPSAAPISPCARPSWRVHTHRASRLAWTTDLVRSREDNAAVESPSSCATRSMTVCGSPSHRGRSTISRGARTTCAYCAASSCTMAELISTGAPRLCRMRLRCARRSPPLS